MEDRIEKYSSMLIETSNNEDDEQATNERTLFDASYHAKMAIDELDIFFETLKWMKEAEVKTLIIDGPILERIPDIHDLIVKVYNTVEYLREQEDSI